MPNVGEDIPRDENAGEEILEPNRPIREDGVDVEAVNLVRNALVGYEIWFDDNIKEDVELPF